MLDYIAMVCFENNMPALTTAVVETTAFALYAEYGLKFPDYRLGIDFKILGMDMHNWKMIYTFLP
ncbi:hypothetical protein A2154_04695 [Candidatus Gottesmanbacteria bacterium RBG_16_43_7]|uniref:Uncharacterized protein n=1 Tax=Candidatus Gottesmanbacteria bacterium RBG_16_43_7 TaxID=1798373 RepID=A0A1F5Z7U8_9BACT|nr:MAG: hypothetical protein A2154_04695 [Candidatus Gottesmanbacteria bacterium RBG_16_43_7]